MFLVYLKVVENVVGVLEQNISQLALSLAIEHKAVGTVYMAELCIQNKHFNIEHLIKIADILEIDICDFFQDTKIKTIDSHL